jgi:hypothetical protein
MICLSRMRKSSFVNGWLEQNRRGEKLKNAPSLHNVSGNDAKERSKNASNKRKENGLNKRERREQSPVVVSEAYGERELLCEAHGQLQLQEQVWIALGFRIKLEDLNGCYSPSWNCHKPCTFSEHEYHSNKHRYSFQIAHGCRRNSISYGGAVDARSVKTNLSCVGSARVQSTGSFWSLRPCIILHGEEHQDGPATSTHMRPVLHMAGREISAFRARTHCVLWYATPLPHKMDMSSAVMVIKIQFVFCVRRYMSECYRNYTELNTATLLYIIQIVNHGSVMSVRRESQVA